MDAPISDVWVQKLMHGCNYARCTDALALVLGCEFDAWMQLFLMKGCDLYGGVDVTTIGAWKQEFAIEVWMWLLF